jgi:sialic acid synthase SpsE
MDLSKFSLQPEVRIGGKKVGHGLPVFIIAEIGNNHNGSVELAEKSIKAAALAGADAVKFQKRTVSEVFTKELLDKEQTHSRILGKTYGEYRRALELKDEELAALKDLAHSLGLAFFVTPFDLTSAKVLADIGMDCWKIASFDSTHPQLLEFIAKQNQPIFLSTGMTSLEEIDMALSTILPHNNQIVMNHCVSIYPTPPEDLNLGAITTMIRRYTPIPIGYSGHEIGYTPTIVAVALGACAVERHFTLDKSLPGPDHATVSLEPHEFAHMVTQIRSIEKAIADKEKYVHEREIIHRNKHGKSVVAKRPIPAGTVITEDMLTIKSPGYGIRPYLIHTVIGRLAKEDIPEDTVIVESFLV